jgi:pyridoxal phosphate enzyme (YggS family)
MAMDELSARIRQVHARIAEAAGRSGRSAEAVTLVAVTKTVPVERVRLAYEAGLRVFGENRVQEAREKVSALASLPLIHWHLIGHLQTNKVARAVELFEMVQSVDSVRLAEALNRGAEARGKRLPVLLEVNVAGEVSKEGVRPEALAELAEVVVRLPYLEAQGLMTVAPYTQNPEEVRPVFRRLRELGAEMRERFPLARWQHLSMGMSEDYGVAIEEGATMVRLGRALFGERPQ